MADYYKLQSLTPFRTYDSLMSYADEIREFGERFRGRLDQNILDQALDYLNYNEEALSVEMLCENLFEYEIEITAEEAQRARELAKYFAIESSALNRIDELIS